VRPACWARCSSQAQPARKTYTCGNQGLGGPVSALLAETLPRLGSTRESAKPLKPELNGTFDRGLASLRGLAVLMLVAFHALDADSLVPTGRVDPPLIGLLLGFVRVPLFAVVAGYLSGSRSIRGASLAGFVSDRAQRLLVPWLSVTTLMLALRWMVPGTSERLPLTLLWTAYAYPYEHLWYLPALFVTSILIGLLDSLQLLETPRASAWTLLIATGLSCVLSAPELFSLVGVPLLLPFVLLGFVLRRHGPALLVPRVLVSAFVVVVIGYTCLFGYWFFALPVDVARKSPLYLAVGIATNLLLMRARRPVPALERIARYAYPIYLFHLIGISIGARLGHAAHVEHRFAQFLLELACGLIISVIAAKLTERTAFTRLLFLGSSEKKPTRSEVPVVAPDERTVVP
jgi:glucan biosynthesis protein C